MISFSSKNNIGLLNNFILPKEFRTHSKDGWRPAVSVKARILEAKRAEGQNLQRKTWHFLTLGIPLIFNSLALFFSGLLHRDTVDFPLRVRFKEDRLSFDERGRMIKFRQFNVPASTILNEAAQNKGRQLLLRLINKLDTAKAGGHEDQAAKCSKQLDALRDLLEKNATPGFTRYHLDESNWRMLDKIGFKLVKEHFERLIELFNSEWMSTSGLKRELQGEFGFHYMEAVVAESLALVLAYVEGIEGKTVLLPVFNEKLKTYEPAPFVIKKTTLGDALPCYILESEKACVNPWLVIRGSQVYTGISPENKEFRQGSLESLLTDALDPECISGNVINKALVTRPIIKENGHFIQKESLSDIFRNWREKGTTVNLSGHSLGGTLVNALTVEFYDQVNTAYSFSGAGVSHKTAERYMKIMRGSAKPEAGEKLMNFDYEGDIVPSGGRRLIGTHLAITPLQERSKSIYDSHSCSHLNQDFQIQKIDVERETHKRTRIFCERLRVFVGTIFNLLLQLFSRKYIPDWWKNRKVYAHRAKCERKLRFASSHSR